MKIRPRVFLEGNFFVDIKPGSPSAPTLDSGKTIPTTQTAAPVQFGDVLSALQSDTRSDLQVFLKEYSKGLEGQGAEGFNEALRTGPAAFRSTAVASDALLGLEPTKDLQRVFRGQARTFAALNEDENALKGLVTNFNTVAGAFASQDAALERSIPALDRTLRVGSPALASLNSALPTLRVFSREALPGVRSSGPTLEASLPFIRQARLLVRPSELRGTARQLRLQIPNFVTLSKRSQPLLRQARAAVLVHQQRAGALRQHAGPQPRRAQRHQPEAAAPGQPRLRRPVRREPRERRQPVLLPHQRGGAAAERAPGRPLRRRQPAAAAPARRAL